MDRRYTFSPAFLIAVLLTLAVLGTYWPVQKYDFVNFDDDEYVFDNPHVKTGLTLKNIVWAFTKSHSANWHPLTWVSHMVDSELFGLNAGGHHLMNLYIHLANVLLLFFLLKKITAATWRSAFVAALFALHPLHVESVAWISERKDVLSAFFLFLAIGAYYDYAQRPRPVSYLRVALWFIAGLMTKPMVVTLPFLLLVLDYWPLNRLGAPEIPPARRRAGTLQRLWNAAGSLCIEKLPLIALSIASCAITMIVQKKAMFPIDPLVRMANAAISYAQYIVSTFVPLHLSIYYPYPHKVSLRLGILAATMLVVISVAVFWKVRKFPWLVTGWLWFVGTLVPVIGIIQVGAQARADRYTYIPLIGLFVIIAWGGREIFKKSSFRKTVFPVFAFSCIIMCAVFARAQLLHWENSLTLFKYAVTVTKNNSMAHNNLGVTFFEKGNIDSAISHYQESMRIMPNGLAAFNRGVIAGKKNELKKAIVYLNEGIRLDSNYARAYFSLGQVYKLYGNDSLALMQFKKAILVDPDSWEAFHSLGIIRYNSDSLTKAISCFLRELEINPQSWAAYNDLGLAWSKKGNFQRAFYYLIQGIRTCPDSSWEPYLNLGMLLLKKGKLNSAKGLFSHAIRLSPTQTLTYVNRAAIYILQNNLDSAIADYSEILRLKPDMAFAHYHLGLVFEKKDVPDSSEIHFSKAHAIDPKNVAYGIKANPMRRVIKK